LHVYGAGLDLEGFAHFVQIEGLAVRGADHVNVAAKGFGQAYPALTELARAEDQYAVSWRGDVRDGRFHRTGAGGGEQNDVILGADEGLQIAQNLRVEGTEFRGAVVDVRRCHGELGCRKKRGRAWRE
jgi:hypothetical protein